MGHIKKIEKQTDNKFLNLYHIDFKDRAGADRDYYFVSRRDEEHIKIRTREMTPEGIVIYAVTREEEPRLVMVKEYRFPLDEEIYELPAGLIDPGETPGTAAARELKEETGVHFTEYEGGESFYRRPFCLVPGFSDETGTAVFGYADDLDGQKDNETSEWIEVVLADRNEVQRILKEERVSLRGAYLMFEFLRADNKKSPFAFLEGKTE
ncbi:MAG TPA: NUDIX hydrolase [Lachnospiraceae bacterium]|nr:NUDIX hydrolase [Lachnospiraceae bacterium]